MRHTVATKGHHDSMAACQCWGGIVHTSLGYDGRPHGGKQDLLMDQDLHDSEEIALPDFLCFRLSGSCRLRSMNRNRGVSAFLHL